MTLHQFRSYRKLHCKCTISNVFCIILTYSWVKLYNKLIDERLIKIFYLLVILEKRKKKATWISQNTSSSGPNLKEMYSFPYQVVKYYIGDFTGRKINQDCLRVTSTPEVWMLVDWDSAVRLALIYSRT